MCLSKRFPHSKRRLFVWWRKAARVMCCVYADKCVCVEYCSAVSMLGLYFSAVSMLTSVCVACGLASKCLLRILVLCSAVPM